MKRLIKNLYTMKGGNAGERIAELKLILGLGDAAYTDPSAYITHALATAENDFLVASGSGAYVKKTLAEMKAILYATATPTVIDIPATSTRAIRIGTKESAATSVTISTGGKAVDAEPANNYLLGLFSKVAATEAASTDELRGAWVRTRVNAGSHIGASANWGYGVCGMESQVKIYGTGASATNVYAWQCSGLWGQLETEGNSVAFKDGCVASALFANVGLTATTVIDSGAVACGVGINSDVAGSGVTATGGLYGLYIYQDNSACLDFTDGIHIDAGSCTRAINIAGGIFAMGAQGSGIPVTTDYPFGFDLHVKPVTALTAGDTGKTCGIRMRYEVGADQTNMISVMAISGHLRPKKDLGDGTHAGVEGLLEASEVGTVLSGTATTQRMGGHFALSLSADVSVIEGWLTGITVDSSVNAGTTLDSTVEFAGVRVKKTGSAQDWEYGIHIADATTAVSISTATTGIDFTGGYTTGINFIGGDTYVPMLIGTKANTSGSGLILAGDSDDSGGVQIYCDDGGVTTVGDVLSPLRCRYLVTVGQTSGKTQCGSFSQVRTLGTTGSPLVFDTGSVRAAYIFNQLGGNTLATSAEVQGINQATTLAGNMIVGSGCRFAGVDINIAGSGAISNSGICAALLIRSKETPVWTNGIQIEDAGAVTGIHIGTMATGINLAGTMTDAINVADAANVTNLFKFDAIAGCVQSNDVNPKDIPSGGGLGADGCIKIDIGGADYFIPIFAEDLS